MRVDLFDIEIESLRWFSTFTQRSLGETDSVEIAPAAELAAEHREVAEIAAISEDEDRPDVAELLPVDRFQAFLDLAPGRRGGDHRRRGGRRARARRPLAGRLRRLPRRGRPPPLRQARRRSRAALDDRARGSASARSPPTSRFEFRAQAADVAARSLKEAEPELEKLVRCGYRTVVTWPRRGEGERAAYNLARMRAGWIDGARGRAQPRAALRRRRTCATASSPPACASPSSPSTGSSAAAAPSARGRGRPPARRAALVRRPAHRRHRRPRGPRPRAVRRLRDEDRRRRHARLPGARVRRHRQGLHAGRPAREDQPLRRRGRRAPAAVQARRQVAGRR